MTDIVDPRSQPDDPEAPPKITGGMIARGGARVLTGTALAVPLGLIASVLFARLLGTDEFGTFLLGFSVAAAASTIAQLGLQPILVREVAAARAVGDSDRTRAAVTQSLSLASTAGILLAVVIVSPPGRSFLEWAFGSEDVGSIVPLIAVLAVATALLALIAQSFRGFTDLSMATLLQQVWLPAGRVLVFGALAIFSVDGLTAAYGLWAVIGTAAAGIVIGGLVLRRRLPPRGEGAPPGYRLLLLQESWPLLLNALLLMVLTQVDIWAVGAGLDRSEVGIYGAAVRIAAIVSLSLVVLNSTITPFAAHMWARGEKENMERRLRLGATVAFAPALLGTLILVFAGSPILSLLFGSEYAAAATPLAILAIGHTINVLTGSSRVALNMTGNQRWSLLAALIAGAVTVAIIFPVTAAHGITGAAIVAASGKALQNLLGWRFAYHRTGVYTHIAPVMATRMALSRWRSR